MLCEGINRCWYWGEMGGWLVEAMASSRKRAWQWLKAVNSAGNKWVGKGVGMVDDGRDQCI